MSDLDLFFKQAGAIHDVHIKQMESTEEKIATKRIEQFFKGELNLGWKTIIYEINKLPELQRNTYIKKLVEFEKAETAENVFKSLKKMNFLKRIKFLLKGL